MMGEKDDRMGRIAAGIRLRLPLLLFVLFMALLHLNLPYRGINSDSAVFGIMGNDILTYHYAPTLMQGQNYLISLLPYLYAGVRAALPVSVPPVFSFALAGFLFSATGLWLMFEALLLRLTNHPRRVQAGFLFFVLMLCSPGFVFELGISSGVENMFFLIGVVMYALARMEKHMSCAAAAPAPLWLVLGWATGFGYFCRPHVAFYTIAALPVLVLFYRTRRLSAAAALLAGLLIGILPKMLHEWLVADSWPYDLKIGTAIGSWPEIRQDLFMLFDGIIPRLYTLSGDHLLHARTTWAGLLAVPLLALIALVRRRMTLTDAAWLGGTLLILALMAAIPALSFNTEQRRYCFAMMPTTAWALTVFCWYGSFSRRIVTAYAAVLFILSVPVWSDRMCNERAINAEWRDTSLQLVPELQQHPGVFLTDYWDAYALAFLADGRITVEAYPWELIRSYGLVTPDQFRAKTHWLIKSGYGHTTAERLQELVGGDALAAMQGIALTNRLAGRECELWVLPPDTDIPALFQMRHPRYFQTHYPAGTSGSGR